MIFKSLDTDPLIPNTDPDMKHWYVQYPIGSFAPWLTCPTLEIDVLYRLLSEAGSTLCQFYNPHMSHVANIICQEVFAVLK